MDDRQKVKYDRLDEVLRRNLLQETDFFMFLKDIQVKNQ